MTVDPHMITNRRIVGGEFGPRGKVRARIITSEGDPVGDGIRVRRMVEMATIVTAQYP